MLSEEGRWFSRRPWSFRQFHGRAGNAVAAGRGMVHFREHAPHRRLRMLHNFFEIADERSRNSGSLQAGNPLRRWTFAEHILQERLERFAVPYPLRVGRE